MHIELLYEGMGLANEFQLLIQHKRAVCLIDPNSVLGRLYLHDKPCPVLFKQHSSINFVFKITMFYNGIIALFLTLGTSAHEFIATNPIACQFAVGLIFPQILHLTVIFMELTLSCSNE
jgi:hypothetical protein